jgi:hypothetical protein
VGYERTHPNVCSCKEHIEKNTKNRRLAMGTKGRKNVKKPKQNKEKKK